MAGDLTVGQLRVILEADSSEFAAAMKDANADSKKLADSLKKDLEPSTRGVNAAFKQFIGTNEIRRAQEMAEAVKRIGGVSRLTEADQRKLNAAVQDALVHYKALGSQAPKNLLDLEKATRSVAESTKGLGDGAKHVGVLESSFLKLTSAFTAANLISKAVTSILDLGAGAVKSAGQIVDLSQKTGLSIEAVQRYGFVAKQSGGSVEQMADAVFKTGIQIEKGGKKVESAFRDLGLSFQEIRNLAPEQQFDAIMRALASIEDPQERNRIGVELMGKAYGNVAASVDGYVDALKNAPVANADAIRATDAAADAIERAWDKAEKAAINAIGGIVLAWERGGKLAAEGQAQNENAIRALTAAGIPRFVGQAIIGAAAPEEQVDKIKPFRFDLAHQAPPTKAIQDYVAELKQANLEVLELTKSERAQIAAAIELGESTEDIANAMNISGRAVEILKDRLKEGDTAAKQKADSLKNLKSGLSDLTDQQYEQIASLLAAGKAEADIAKAYGFTAQQVKEVAEAEKIHADLSKQLALATEKARQAIIKEVLERQKAQENLAASLNDLTDIEIEQIAVNLRLGKSQKDIALAYGFTEAQVAMVAEAEKDLADVRKKIAEDAKRHAKAMQDGIDATAKMQGELESLIAKRTLSSFDFQRSQIEQWAAETKANFKGTEQQAVEFYDLVDRVAREKMLAVTATWASAFKGIGDLFVQLSQLAEGEMSDVAQSLGSVLKTVEILDASFDELRSGIDALQANEGPEQLIAGLVGVTGAIAQAVSMAIELGKALHDAFTRSEAEKAAADIRRTFGDVDKELANIGEDSALAQSIERMVKDLNIDRNLAFDLHLGDIIDAAGGIDSKNFEEFRTRAFELFDDIRLGGEIGTLAMEELDQVIGQLGEHVVEVGGLWDEEFIKMLRIAQAEGLELASVMELVKGQLDIAAGGLNKTVTGAKPQDQGDFDRLSRLSLATFNAFVANGQSAAQAIEAIGPSIDALKQSVTDFGFAGNDAFNQLSRWRDLVSANQPLIDSLAGLNEMMVALANVGALDAQTFADMQAQGLDTFNSLTAAGFSQTEALAQMKPMLETLRKLHKERGLAIDDETQALIDQAEQQGILAEEQQSTNEVLKETNLIMLEGFAAIIQAAGGEVPAALQKMLDSARTAAEGVEDALNSIEVDPIDVEVNVDDRQLHGLGVSGFKRGGVVDAGAGSLAVLHGREAIVPLEGPDAPEWASLIEDWNAGPSLPSLSMSSALSGADGSMSTSTDGQPIYLMVDSRVLGEVSAQTDSRASSRLGLMRS